MKMDIKKGVVFVTGANRGIGRALVSVTLQFAADLKQDAKAVERQNAAMFAS